MVKSVVVLILLTISSLPLSGQQQDCEAVLAEATDEFNAGHFYSIPSILDNCLTKFTSEQRLRAHLLLVQTYLLLDNPIGAKTSYLEVLKENPEFVPNLEALPIDVVYLSKQFTTDPIFSWFIKAGTNLSPIRVIYDLSAYGNTNVEENYDLKLGYQAALGGEFYKSERLGIRTEIGYVATAFTHSTRNFFGNDKKDISERQHWLGLPVAIAYYSKRPRYKPYGYVGYEGSWLLKDVMNINLSKVEGEDSSDQKSPDIDATNKRNRINQSVLFGGGIKYKLGLDYLFVDLRYSFGLKNIVRPDALYADYSNDPISTDFIKSLEVISHYAHVDDYYRIDSIAISVGFVRPIYKPRELKEGKTKTR